ncbi:uncharacterized protein [Amphiura filiformis]|uniref:uncharacterized protein n=1 Tax=Amphiura filiformis TaxID=82378 RepID=UPI003B2266E1
MKMLLLFGGSTADDAEKEVGDNEGTIGEDIKDSLKGTESSEGGEKIKMEETKNVQLIPQRDKIELEHGSNDSAEEHQVSTDVVSNSVQDVRTSELCDTKTLPKLEENGQILPNSQLKMGSSFKSEMEVNIDGVNMDGFQPILTENKSDEQDPSGSMYKSNETKLQTCVHQPEDTKPQANSNATMSTYDTNPNRTNQITPETIAIELNGTTHHQDSFEKDETKAEKMKRKSVEFKNDSVVIGDPSSSSEEEHVMDEGWAWMVLVAGALNHILGDGVIQSLGVFLVIWQRQFPGSMSQLSWTISLILGVAYIAGPLGSALCKRFSIRQVVMAGTILTSISFTGASQATSLWHLYVTFALAGLGFGLTLQPSYVVLTYYFDKRLARANGTAFAGVGVGIFAIPPFLQLIIDFYGWQSALLIMAAILGNLGVCAAIYRPSKLEIENRTSRPKQKANHSTSFELNYISGMENVSNEQDLTTPRADQLHSNSSPGTHELQIGLESNPKETIEDKYFSQPNSSSQIELRQNDAHPKSSKCDACAKCCSLLELFDFKLLTNFYFVLLLMAYFLHGVAYIIIIHYLSVRAVHSGISEINAAYLISAIGISSLLSRLTHGYIIDYHIMSATVLTAIVYVISGVSSALNPVSDSYPVLICLSVVFGLTSGVFNSTVPIIAKEYVGAKQVSAGTGLILLIIGVSSILGAYVTGVLADATGSYDIPFYLAGACFLICALLIFAFPGIKLLKRHQTGHKDEDDTTKNDQLELCPLGSALCKRFSIRQVVMAGTILTSVSFIGASQATSLWHLYITFALAGLGFGLTLQPAFVVLTYYFDKRLARANGAAFAGVGIGTFAIPPFLQVIIDIYGWQIALLIMAAVLGNLGVCAAIYRPSKLEIENRTSRPKQKYNRNLMQKVIFTSFYFRDFMSTREIRENKNLAKISTFTVNYISGMENVSYEQDQTNSGADQLHSNSIPNAQEHRISLESNQKETTEDRYFSQANSSSQIELHQNDADSNSSQCSACATCCSWGLLDLLTNFYFVLLLIAYFLHGLAYVIVIQYSSVRAVHTGISELNAAYLLSAIGISSLLSRLTHGYIIDYHIMSATGLTALAYVISGVSNVLNPVSDSYPVLICLSVVIGLTSGVFNSTVPIIAKEYVGAKQVSAGTGLILLIIGISSIVGAYVTGVLADATGSYDIPFYLAGACFLICALLIFAFPGIKLLKCHQTRHKDEDGTTKNDQLELSRSDEIPSTKKSNQDPPTNPKSNQIPPTNSDTVPPT